MYKFIFIAGPGRSGTHLVGNMLNTSDKVKLVDETSFVYILLKRASMSRWRLVSSIYILCASVLARFIGLVFWRSVVVFKAHPSIWSYELLNLFIPNAGFLIVERSCYGMVASMFLHEGVNSWYQLDRVYNGPRKMLGISESNKDRFRSYPAIVKYVVKWYVHHQRKCFIESKANVQCCHFEQLNSSEELQRIMSFVGLQFDSSLYSDEVKDKWKSFLSESQVNTINKTLNEIDVYL